MESKQAVTALAALAQETRLDVFRLLVEAGSAGLSVGKIGEKLALAPATLSFHLKELHRAGLVRSSQSGRFIYYSANYQSMNELLAYLTENCCRALCGPSASSCAVAIPAPAVGQEASDG